MAATLTSEARTNIPALSESFALSAQNPYSLDILDPDHNGPDGLNMSRAQLVERDQTNYYMKSKVGGDDEKTEEEKKRVEHINRLSESAITAQTVSFGGMEFSYNTVLDHLSAEAKLDQAFLNMSQHFVEIKDEQMLRLDANGNRVDPKDDPQGLLIVKTLAEKQEYEARTRQNVLGYTQEEVTRTEDGRLVLTEAANDAMRLENKIQENVSLIDQLQSGTVRLDSLSTHTLETVRTREINANEPARIDPAFAKLTEEYAKKPWEENQPAAEQTAQPAAPRPAPQMAPAGPSAF